MEFSNKRMDGMWELLGRVCVKTDKAILYAKGVMRVKKWMAFGMALICMALFAACAREPVQKESETGLPEESQEIIVKSIPEEEEETQERGVDHGITVEETEERNIDPGFTVPAPDGGGDAHMAVPAPEGVLDPDFDIMTEPKQTEGGMVVITPQPQE